ncbi:MAG: mannose-1-phosphate guanylyltransferase/mannose-6-phosphate isomerase [Candidatus Moraniibacteriota bacterium]
MYSVILCGGSGTRLWPLSRKNFPKQFLSLYSNYSLLQETYLRMRDLLPKERILFVSNQENFFNVLNQIQELEADFSQEQILVEPKSLNTAPAIALAAKYLLDKKKVSLKETMLILPSDHYIADKETYLAIVAEAERNINGFIGTIGIVPQSAQTGYGYIQKGKKLGEGWYASKAFREKPDEETAKKYLASGEYVWNAGMYLFQLETFVSEIKLHSPEIATIFEKKYDDFLKDFAKFPSISIDYALSEKSDKVVVFEGDFGWNDIGSFDSLADTLKEEENPRQIGVDSKNVFVHSDTNRLVATIGMEDMVIVDSNDSLLVYKRGHGEDVKKVVDILKERQMKEVEHNILVYRPWGKYEILIDTPTYKVKKITVYPNAKLSLQSHFHRTEHWVVVRGMAKAVNGDREICLNENESTFIPPNTRHRLENPGKMDLELIEVQTGSYLEEDDIIRYDDIYNR